MIPDGLKDRDKWICWKYSDRDGKQAKVPISPSDPTNGPIDAKDPLHWTDLETAQQAAATTEDIEGIGWVLTSDGPIVGIDIDDCRDPSTETIQQSASDIVDSIGSYTEVSPSGTGLHILVKADEGLPGDRNRTGDIEIYDGKRYFTVTGNRIGGSVAIREAQSELNELYREYLSEHTGNPQAGNSDQSENTSGTPTQLDDPELIEKAKNSQNGPEFQRVWNGDYSHQDSHSEARLELYNYLAFWTKKDEQKMWRLFQQSGLYPHPQEKGKCDRLKDHEIQKAINDTRNTYNPDFNSENLPTGTKQVATDGGRLTVSDPTIIGVIDALEDLGKASTAELTEHAKVDRGERQVQRALDYLQDCNAVEWDRDGRSTAYGLLDECS